MGGAWDKMEEAPWYIKISDLAESILGFGG